jgi:hypothetical protein
MGHQKIEKKPWTVGHSIAGNVSNEQQMVKWLTKQDKYRTNLWTTD